MLRLSVWPGKGGSPSVQRAPEVAADDFAPATDAAGTRDERGERRIISLEYDALYFARHHVPSAVIFASEPIGEYPLNDPPAPFVAASAVYPGGPTVRTLEIDCQALVDLLPHLLSRFKKGKRAKMCMNNIRKIRKILSLLLLPLGVPGGLLSLLPFRYPQYLLPPFRALRSLAPPS